MSKLRNAACMILLLCGVKAGAAPSVATAEKIITLAEETFAMVQKEVELPQQSKELQHLIEQFQQSPSEKILGQIQLLRREIIFAHPRLQFDDLLFNLRRVDLVHGYKHLGRLFNGHMVDLYLGGNHASPTPGIVVLKNWKGTDQDCVRKSLFVSFLFACDSGQSHLSG